MENLLKQKKSLLMLLFGIVLIMGIGFAAYGQQLKISDTSSIITSWNVYIKSIDSDASDEWVTGSSIIDKTTNLKADLTTELKYPGDNVVYTITLRNGGSADAILRTIDLIASNDNTVINYKYLTKTGVETVDSNLIKQEIMQLNSNEEKSFRLKVEYDPTKTGTATQEQKQNSLKIDIVYDSVEE